MLICFAWRTCFVEQALGLGFVMKAEPALIVHTGNRIPGIPVYVPPITSFQNAECFFL